MQALLRPLSLLLALAGAVPTLAYASKDNDRALPGLFREPAHGTDNPARHTFVFWVNGAQDHFVTATGDGTGSGHLYRGDAIEVERLRKVAESCASCNVVLLHVQRGGAHWYTANAPWATYLRVYSRGKKMLERHVETVDETDPRLLAELLDFSEDSFPDSTLHLIYRGHSFRAPYVPGSQVVTPFDYSNPEHGYGETEFVLSIKRAQLHKPLGSLTLASCSQSSAELASQLSPLARYFVASEVDILETLDVGFRFDSLRQVTDWMGSREVSYLIANRMFDAFRSTPSVQDTIEEFPATWLDLSQMSAISLRWNRIVDALESLPAHGLERFRSAAIQKAALMRRVSERYIQALRSQGKSPAAIAMLTQVLQMPSELPGDLDLGLTLDLIDASPQAASVAPLSADLRKVLGGYAYVINGSPLGGKLGLSVSLAPRGGADNLPLLDSTIQACYAYENNSTPGPELEASDP